MRKRGERMTETTDRLKEKVEDYMQERKMNGIAFCRAAQVNEIKFYLWLYNDNYYLDNISRAKILGYLNREARLWMT